MTAACHSSDHQPLIPAHAGVAFSRAGDIPALQGTKIAFVPYEIIRLQLSKK